MHKFLLAAVALFALAAPAHAEAGPEATADLNGGIVGFTTPDDGGCTYAAVLAPTPHPATSTVATVTRRAHALVERARALLVAARTSWVPTGPHFTSAIC